MTATLADLLDASPLARRWADRIAATHRDLQVPNGDWALVAACRIYADVRDGLAALDTLAAIDALHQPRTWQDGVTVVCDHCQTAYPCADRRLLDGLPADRDEEIA